MNEEQINSFPEQVREWDEVKNSDSPEVFWDRITNMRSKLGTGVYQPGKDAGDEDWAKFINKSVELSAGRLMPKPNLDDPAIAGELYASLGRPENADGYEFEEIEGAEVQEDRKALLSDIAFKTGMSKAQLRSLESEVRKADLAAIHEQQEAFHTSLTALKQEWGMATDERMHMAKKVVAAFFPHIPEDAPLTADEIKAFYSLSKQLGGEGTKELLQQGRNDTNAMTPDEAVEKISEMRNNKDHPYNNPRDPGHIMAKKKMRNLYLIKSGQPPE